MKECNGKFHAKLLIEHHTNQQNNIQQINRSIGIHIRCTYLRKTWLNHTKNNINLLKNIKNINSAILIKVTFLAQRFKLIVSGSLVVPFVH